LGCRVELGGRSREILETLQKDMVPKIEERSKELSENPICERKLKGRLEGLCRTRVGSYRIIYMVKPCTIIVVYIGKRESIYEELR